MKRFVWAILGMAAMASGVSAQDQSVFHTADPAEGPQPWTHLNFFNDPMNFKFAVVTDRTGGLRPGIFETAVHKLNLLMPEFVMSVGDFIPGGTTDIAQVDREWTDFERVLSPLKVPFFFVPGNHDISNDAMRVRWMEKYGRSYHHFVYKDILFLQLDSTTDHGDVVTDAQIAYAKEVLEANPDVRWTYVFFHHPLWLYDDPGGWPQIEAMLQGRKHTVFAGHQHRYRYNAREHPNYYALATTGGGSRLRGPLFGEFDHVTLVTVTNDGPVIANLRLEGILPHDVTTPEDLELAYSLARSTQFESLLLTSDGDSMNGATVYFTFTNPSTMPLEVYGRFFHGHGVAPEKRELHLTLDPGATERVTSAIDVSEANPDEPLQFDWTMGFDFEGREDVMMSGTQPISVAPAGLDLIETLAPSFDEPIVVALEAAPSGTTLRYTTDGTDPSGSSPVYEDPIEIAATTELRVRAFSEDGSHASAVASRTFAHYTGNAGLDYRYFRGDFWDSPEYADDEPVLEAVTPDLNLDGVAIDRTEFGITFEGALKISTAGTYTFHLSCDDLADLQVNGEMLVDMNVRERGRPYAAEIELEPGAVPFQLDYIQRGGGMRLSLEIEGPGVPRQAVPASMFIRN